MGNFWLFFLDFFEKSFKIFHWVLLLRAKKALQKIAVFDGVFFWNEIWCRELERW